MKTHVSSQELQEVGSILGVALPATFFQDRLLVGRTSGERALLWAVFADGISRYWRLAADPHKIHSQEFLEEECWLLADDTGWLFAFVNLCEIFSLDPKEVRVVLLAWKCIQTKTAVPSSPWRKAA